MASSSPRRCQQVGLSSANCGVRIPSTPRPRNLNNQESQPSANFLLLALTEMLTKSARETNALREFSVVTQTGLTEMRSLLFQNCLSAKMFQRRPPHCSLWGILIPPRVRTVPSYTRAATWTPWFLACGPSWDNGLALLILKAAV